jgi:hypothetical protein
MNRGFTVLDMMSQDSKPAGRDSNTGYTKYEAGQLTTTLQRDNGSMTTVHVSAHASVCATHLWQEHSL